MNIIVQEFVRFYSHIFSNSHMCKIAAQNAYVAVLLRTNEASHPAHSGCAQSAVGTQMYPFGWGLSCLLHSNLAFGRIYSP